MLWLSFHTLALHAAGFEGRIHVSIAQGSQTNTLLYTIGPEHLRIEATGGNGLNPINILHTRLIWAKSFCCLVDFQGFHAAWT